MFNYLPSMVLLDYISIFQLVRISKLDWISLQQFATNVPRYIANVTLHNNLFIFLQG
jgi:hypothetical protein